MILRVTFGTVYQRPKLSFWFVHSQGALPIKLCTRKLLHAPSQYIPIINGSKNVHTPGAHLQKSCTRPWKCARRVQGALLISDTVYLCIQESTWCGFKACIPVVIAFALGTQRDQKRDKQREIYMANARPPHWGPNAIYIPPAHVGSSRCG